MRTKPSATSAYITPASSPPATTSRKKLMGDSQIGVDHLLVLLDLGRHAVGDLAAVVEHHHPVGDVHHHAHVVLDQDEGGAELVVDVKDEAAHVLLFLEVHSRHRLIEQQQLGLRGERAAELDAL